MGCAGIEWLYIEVAKKAGKSSLLAALGIFHADHEGDGEPRPEVYVAATTKYQSASIVFREALRLRNESTAIASRTKAFRTSITWPQSLGKFEPLAANSDKLNGLNISFGILDELGDHPTGTLFEVFNSSTVNRSAPLILSITTAGSNRENIAWYQRQRAAHGRRHGPDDALCIHGHAG